MSLLEQHQQQKAILAPDGIPQSYGDLAAEYHAALNNAVLMDRSHEGRLTVHGADRADFLQRISTNNLLQMQAEEGRPTIFTNANGRILDRVMVYNRADHLLLTTEPGRGVALRNALQRQIFFKDQVSLADLAPQTHQFVLHGINADAVIESLITGASAMPPLFGIACTVDGVSLYATRRKPLVGTHWSIIVARKHAESIWQKLAQSGVQLAGSLTYNTLRIRAGRPGGGRELSADYIPLEAGLWDEVSFSKGCYTGQEIIARMESRQRLAKVMVKCRLSAWQESPAELSADGKTAGTLTSSVQTPDGEILGIAFVKLAFATIGQTLNTPHAAMTITEFAGAPPPLLAQS